MDKIESLTAKQFIRTILTIPNTLKLIFNIEKRYAIYLIILNVLTAMSSLVSLIIFQELINSIYLSSSYLIFVVIIYFILQILISLLGQVESYIDGKFNFNLSYSIDRKLMETINSLELSELEQSDMYNIIEKITQESTYKPYQLFNAILQVLSSVVTMISSLIFIATWNISMAMLLGVIPIISLVMFLRIGQLEFLVQWERANEERETWYIRYLLTHDFSFKEIKINDLSSYFIEKFSKFKQSFIKQDLKIARKKAYFNIILGIILNTINLFIALSIIIYVRAGKLLIGNFVSLIQVVARVNSSSQSLIQNIYIVYNTSLFIEQFFEFMETNNVKKENKQANITHLNKLDEINIHQLNYRYPNTEDYALKDINLSFTRGELVAIVGGNGSGKSTLVKLISGLYTPSSGVIEYDGMSGKFLDDTFYKENISVLFQDYVKYELSLRENIGLSDTNSMRMDHEIIQLLEKLGLDFLKVNGSYDLDLQLGTWFRNGRQLSGGQWQKIALARTFFKKSSIYILDEPSSALDSISQKEIFDHFIELSKNDISIFVSHDLEAAKIADRIIVMRKGKVEDIGTHSELFSRCKYYKELYESQQYEEINEYGIKTTGHREDY